MKVSADTTNRRIDAPAGLLLFLQCISITSTNHAMADEGTVTSDVSLSDEARPTEPAEQPASIDDNPADKNEKETESAKRAEAFFDSGVISYSRSDYAGAAVEFERSLSILPTRMAYFNLANCFLALQKYGQALTTLEELRASFRGTIDESWNQEVSALETRLQALAAKLSIKVDENGASVRVDGKPRATGPVDQTFYLDPGTHELKVVKPGYLPYTRTLLIAPKERTSIRISLRRSAPASVAQVTPPGIALEEPTDDSIAGLSVLFWTSAATAVATGSLAAGFIALAESEAADFREVNDIYGGLISQPESMPLDDGFEAEQRQRYDELREYKDRAELFGWLSVGFATAAVVAGAVAIVSLVVDGGDDEPAAATISATPGGAVMRF